MKLLIYKDGKKSKWLDKYNEVIQASADNPRKVGDNEDGNRYSLHHIYPRSLYPELKNKEENKAYLKIRDHFLIHYYLWKHDSKYASQFWFLEVWWRKNMGEDFCTHEEYEQLKQDLKEIGN